MTRVWMSLQTKEKNHYVIRLTAGMAGIILLAFLLIFLCARIIIELDEYKEIISLLMCRWNDRNYHFLCGMVRTCPAEGRYDFL